MGMEMSKNFTKEKIKKPKKRAFDFRELEEKIKNIGA